MVRQQHTCAATSTRPPSMSDPLSRQALVLGLPAAPDDDDDGVVKHGSRSTASQVAALNAAGEELETVAPTSSAFESMAR